MTGAGPNPQPDVASATTPPRWIYVCPLASIVPNTGVCAKVGAKQVAVFRLTTPEGVDDIVHAIDNFDPRSGANVLSRGLVGDLGGVVCVASPVYKNHYAFLTGRCLEDDRYRVDVFPVRVAEGNVFVRGEAA